VKLKRFFIDFFLTLFTFAYYSLLGLVEIVSQILLGLKKLTTDYLWPLTNHLLSDLAYISLIVYQGFLSVSSSVCLFLSKQLFGMAKVLNTKSEEALQRLWLSE